jgi:hypothetical protein
VNENLKSIKPMRRYYNINFRINAFWRWNRTLVNSEGRRLPLSFTSLAQKKQQKYNNRYFDRNPLRFHLVYRTLSRGR